VPLRRQGKSRREIKEILRIGSNTTLNEALRGEPPPPWTRRPNAKDDVRAKARALREQGLDYSRIAAELGVSKSSVSLWVRDMPRPPHLSRAEVAKRQAAGLAAYWAEERPRREAARSAVRATAAAQVGSLSQREVLIAGAMAYWCEGAKNKPHRTSDRVQFSNTDPRLIELFLRFLDVVGVSRDRLIFRVGIHESADISAAQRYWLQVTQAEPAQFRPATIKRHNPMTTRKNTGENYHGCLRIDVRHSIALYRQIEGWARAILSQPESSIADTNSSSKPGLPLPQPGDEI
jgi:transposase